MLLNESLYLIDLIDCISGRRGIVRSVSLLGNTVFKVGTYWTKILYMLSPVAASAAHASIQICM